MAEKDSPRHILPIEIVALDYYFKPGQRVDLIKMDIPGYELHALRGAGRVLRENSTISVLLELWPFGLKQAGAGWEPLIALLRGVDEDLRIVRTHRLVPFNAADVRSDASWYVSLFATRRGRKPEMK
jgi:hypothetical protein